MTINDKIKVASLYEESVALGVRKIINTLANDEQQTWHLPDSERILDKSEFVKKTMRQVKKNVLRIEAICGQRETFEPAVFHGVCIGCITPFLQTNTVCINCKYFDLKLGGKDLSNHAASYNPNPNPNPKK